MILESFKMIYSHRAQPQNFSDCFDSPIQPTRKKEIRMAPIVTYLMMHRCTIHNKASSRTTGGLAMNDTIQLNLKRRHNKINKAKDE